MSVYRCPICQTHVEYMTTRFQGEKYLFEYEAVPVELINLTESWAPGHWTIKAQRKLCMAPLRHYGHILRQKIRFVLRLHSAARCTQLYRERQTLASVARLTAPTPMKETA